MSSNTKGILVVGGVAVIIYLLYKSLINKSFTQMREELWGVFIKNSPSASSLKETYFKTQAFTDKQFIKEWYRAYSNNFPSFTYNGKLWDAKTGLGI